MTTNEVTLMSNAKRPKWLVVLVERMTVEVVSERRGEDEANFGHDHGDEMRYLYHILILRDIDVPAVGSQEPYGNPTYSILAVNHRASS